MKQILILGLAGLFLFGCGSKESSQSDVPATNGVLTASWGDSRDSAKASFATQGLQLVIDSTDLVYAGGSFEGYAVEQWVFTFSDEGGLSSAKITIAPDTAGSAQTVQGLETRLTEKFGQPVAPMLWKETAAGDHTSSYMIMLTGADRVMVHIEGMMNGKASAEMRSETPTVE